MAKCMFCDTETDQSQCPQCGAIVTLPPSQVLKRLNPFMTGPARAVKAAAEAVTADPADNFRQQIVVLRGGPLDGKQATIEILKGVWPSRFSTIANEQIRACWYELRADGPNRVYQFSKYKESDELPNSKA